MIAKVIRKQDAGLKLKPAKSGETSLNISNELAEFLGGKDGEITFRLYRNDLILALANIIRNLPLYKTNSKSYEEVSLSPEFCDALYKEINDFFKDDLSAFYKVKLLIRPDGRNYLNNLKNGSFSIRDYLVELHNKIAFKKINGNVYDLRLLSQFGTYNPNEDKATEEELPAIIEEKLPEINEDTIPQFIGIPLQQITYGAPGTGKSHGINTLLNTINHVRTTFHPDSDYASFVGAYKPTMVKQEKRRRYDVLDNDNKHEEEEIIAYKFVPQAFIKAYVSAWKNYPKETVLVIEEINRGNCAQIFGDLFQLLDRKDNGFSSYPIDADADIAQYLCSELKDILPNEGDVSEINNVFSENYPDGIVEQIKNGTKLLLPNNLYIWATMNTSDQSLFPIDSAFKRRWDWKFVKISDAHKNWTIHFGDEACSWWEFIKKMNKIIAKETSSDDKKLGYFFCKPSNEDKDFISEERFVGKVLFYLWNDVFKDGETKYFKVTDDPEDEPTFEAFYNDDCTPCVAAIRKFIVGIVGEENVHSIDKTEQSSKEEKPDEDNKSTWSEADKSRYEFWEQFLNYANEKSEDFAKYFGGVKKASKDHWKNFTIPNVDFYLGALQLRQKKQAKVEVYFDETTETYHNLFAHKAEIEKEMGVTYEWRENPDKKASVIEEILPNIDFDNKEKWTDVFDFFIDRLLRMREVFLKYAQMS